MLFAIARCGARSGSQRSSTIRRRWSLPFPSRTASSATSARALNPLTSGVPELLLIELSRNPAVRTVEPARLRACSRRRNSILRTHRRRGRIARRPHPRARNGDPRHLHRATAAGPLARRLHGGRRNRRGWSTPRTPRASRRISLRLRDRSSEHSAHDMRPRGLLPEDSRRARDTAQKASYQDDAAVRASDRGARCGARAAGDRDAAAAVSGSAGVRAGEERVGATALGPSALSESGAR